MHASVKILGHYRLVEKIGEGGMGEVYRAWDERLERDVAVKVLPPGTLTDESSRKRFRKEALSLSKLNHPSVATIHDFDTEGGVDFLVMEYIPGVTLSERLAQGPVPEKEITWLGQQLAEGLAAAHEHGVIHRDLKPGNLRITRDGRLKILDFGLAKLLPPTTGELPTETCSQTEALAGTLPYMAPEQLRGEPAEARSDVWAAGVVLYEMATGQRPFHENAPTATAAAILHIPAIPPGRLAHHLSPHLENIILKCLEKDPENRYQSAKDLLIDLRRSAVAIPHAEIKHRARWRLKPSLSAGIVAAILALIFLVGMRTRSTKPGAQRIASLAVLPLENLSHDPDQEYFADGMTEELITDLSKIGALRVISRTSVMRFKGVSRPLPEIAGELNVEGIIEGSVRRAGDRIRITAQLVGTAPERHLWAGNYEGDLRDILALQSRVAQEISREVNVTLTQQDQQRLSTARAVKPEAYEAYLKSVHYLESGDPEVEKKGVAYLQEAIAKDPSYAPAYVELAYSYMLSVSGFQVPEDSLPKAKVAALKALEIDSSLAEAHAMLARVVFIYDHDWRTAEIELRRAVELNPASARAHYWLGYTLLALGRSTEALSEIQRAHELDPLAQDTNLALGMTFFLAGQNDRAIEQYRRIMELDPHSGWPHVYLAWSYQKKGMHAEAIAEVEKALADSSSNTQWVANLALAYALAGRKAEARNVMAELDRLSHREYVSSYDRAIVYAALREKESAFAALEKAFEEHSERIVWLRADWRFQTIHSDPRFQGLLQRVGLPN